MLDAVYAQSGPEEPRAHHKPKNEELGGKLNPKPAYRDQSSKMGNNQLPIARKVLRPIQNALGDRERVQDITHVSRNRGIFGDMTNKAVSRSKNLVKTPY